MHTEARSLWPQRVRGGGGHHGSPTGWGAVRPLVLREGPAGRRRGGRHLQDGRGACRASEAVAAGAGLIQADPGRPAVQGHDRLLCAHLQGARYRAQETKAFRNTSVSTATEKPSWAASRAAGVQSGIT